MRVRPVTPERVVTELADRIDGVSSAPYVRVAIDGAPAARPGEIADALVDPLRVRGRPAIRVSTSDYLRPASLRLERGRQDPDAYYEEWLDVNGLRREVLDPTSPGGSGLVLPALWDSASDRSPRMRRVRLPTGGVVLIDGPLLLGHGLPFDVTAHLWLSEVVLERRTLDEDRWKLPAFSRYAEEVRPEHHADVVVRVDRPHNPAIVDAIDDVDT